MQGLDMLSPWARLRHEVLPKVQVFFLPKDRVFFRFCEVLNWLNEPHPTAAGRDS